MTQKPSDKATGQGKPKLTAQERAALRNLRAVRTTLKSLADSYRDAAADLAANDLDAALTNITLGDKYRSLLETHMRRASGADAANADDVNGDTIA